MNNEDEFLSLFMTLVSNIKELDHIVLIKLFKINDEYRLSYLSVHLVKGPGCASGC